MLYEFVISNKTDILARARLKITARKWPAVSPEELENGLPMFLSQPSATSPLVKRKQRGSAT